MITSGIAGRPTGTVRVNPRAPFADRLVGAYLFSQSSGGLSPDLLGRTPLFHDVGGQTLPAAAPFGMGISSGANPTFLSAVAPPYVGSVAVGGVLASTSTGLVLGQGSDVFAMGSFEWGIFVSSGTWRFGYGFLGSSGSGTSAPLGRFDVGLSRGTTTGYGYVNGSQVNSNSSNGGGTSTNPVRGSTVSAGVPFGGVLDYALLFGCWLPDAAFAEIRRNPYQYFQTPRRSLWAPASAAPAAAPPWFLSHDLSGGFLTMGM